MDKRPYLTTSQRKTFGAFDNPLVLNLLTELLPPSSRKDTILL